MEQSISKKDNRIHWIDNARGVSLVSMILYHFMFDLVYIFGVNIGWYRNWQGYYWQQSICITFILLSGISCAFGRNNVKRGAITFAFGMLMTLGTWVAMPSQLIKFGILHFLGLVRIVFGLLENPLKKIKPEIGFAVFLLLFLVTKTVPEGFIGIGDRRLLELPDILYSSKLLFPLGFPHASFWSGDYFPMIPWSFLFLAGFYFWGVLAKLGKKGEGFKQWPLFNFLGRHSLFVYVIHQPICYGILLLLDYFKML